MIAWVYRNSTWSNPCIKDTSLRESIDLESECAEHCYEWEGEIWECYIDNDYDISSESDINGTLVAKLYEDGELNISGTRSSKHRYVRW